MRETYQLETLTQEEVTKHFEKYNGIAIVTKSGVEYSVIRIWGTNEFVCFRGATQRVKMPKGIKVFFINF